MNIVENRQPNGFGNLIAPVAMAGLGALMYRKKPLQGAMMGLLGSGLLSPKFSPILNMNPGMSLNAPNWHDMRMQHMIQAARDSWIKKPGEL